MQLHVVYRYHPGENAKGRPGYYSKALALASLLRSAQACREVPDLVFAHDGPVEDHLREVMQEHGSLHPIRGGSARRSYLSALLLTRRLCWDPADLVLLVEDDYLFVPQALGAVLDAAQALPPGWYVTPYTDDWDEASAPQPEIDGGWRRARSTTSTFGTSVATLGEDGGLLRLCPYSGGAWDTATCLTLQGRPPFTWQRLAVEARGVSSEDDGQGRRRIAARALVRAVLMVRAHRRPSRRRALAAPRPNLATHLEEGWLSPGRNWEQVAEETLTWAQSYCPRLAEAMVGSRGAAGGRPVM